MKRLLVLLSIFLFASSCSMVREIRVVVREGQLAVDFPWSMWRVLGLQDRTYPCVDRVELFNRERLLWSLDAARADGNCVDVAMPIVIGQPKPGFIARGTARLQPGRYGVSVSSRAPARIDFVLQRDRKVRNITDWSDRLQAPCGTYDGEACDADVGSSEL